MKLLFNSFSVLLDESIEPVPTDKAQNYVTRKTVNPPGTAVPGRDGRSLVLLLDYPSLRNDTRVRWIINSVPEKSLSLQALGSWFGSKSKVPRVAGHFSGQRGGLQ